MKTIMTLAIALCSAFAFAESPKDLSGSSFSISKSGAGIINVRYRSQKYGTVMVSILNEKMEKVFSEKMKGENFIRPYNFQNLPEGHYTIQVSDADGTQQQGIDYGISQATKINVSEIGTANGRYLISGFVPSAEKISIKVYNSDSKLIHQELLKVQGKFDRLYNLSAVKGAFSIEISDTNASLLDFSSTAR